MNACCLTLKTCFAGIKYDYGQVTVEELDLGDELADVDVDVEDMDLPDRERQSVSGRRQPCANYERHGSCANGDKCCYKHEVRGKLASQEKPRRQDSNAGKGICRNYASGQCKYGDRCHFKHVAYSAVDKRPPSQYYSSPSSSRGSTPAVSRPNSANQQYGNGQMGRGSRGPSPAPSPSQSRPGSAGQQAGPRLPVVQQALVATFTVPVHKVETNLVHKLWCCMSLCGFVDRLNVASCVAS